MASGSEAMETVLIAVTPTTILQISAITDIQCSESYIHLFTEHLSALRGQEEPECISHPS